MADKILIVDDDIDSLKLIGLMLQRHGYEVVAANAGNQALSKATSEHPSLIILDVMMPDMDGYEVCRRLRANPETKAIPIIMFTAKTLVDDKVAGFEAGADDYLTKPTHPAELASRVKGILARNTTPKKAEPVKGTTIGVIGTKGGVGTTTIALNLATAFQLSGENAIVADFQLGTGSLGLFIGFGQSSGMANVLSKPANEIRPSAIEPELVTHQSGLRALLSSARPKESLMSYPIDAALSVIRSLKTMGRPIVFDLGRGLNSTVSRLQRDLDFVVLVVEPNPVGLTMARELLHELEPPGNAPTGRIHIVIVNRAPTNVQTPWHEVENALGHELRAIISPAPDPMFQAMKANVPLVVHQPNSVVSGQLMKLSEDLTTRIKASAGDEASP
jgi:CheY-like chemotaxis protein/MinD-like ATPase involved in chromosome partitioning or flagellar assembly